MKGASTTAGELRRVSRLAGEIARFDPFHASLLHRGPGGTGKSRVSACPKAHGACVPGRPRMAASAPSFLLAECFPHSKSDGTGSAAGIGIGTVHDRGAW
jgi:hypothetical protein